ncbi:hypothetical protein [Microcystis phage Mae-JY30]
MQIIVTCTETTEVRSEGHKDALVIFKDEKGNAIPVHAEYGTAGSFDVGGKYALELRHLAK